MRHDRLKGDGRMGFKADMALDAVKHRLGCIEKLSKAKDHRTRKDRKQMFDLFHVAATIEVRGGSMRRARIEGCEILSKTLSLTSQRCGNAVGFSR